MTQEELKQKIQEARAKGVPDEVTFKYLNDKGLIPQDKIITRQVTPIQETRTGVEYQPTLSYSGQENPLQAGLKAAVNLPGSAYNLGKGIVSAVSNPLDTIKSIGKVAVGGVEKLLPGQQSNEESFNAFTDTLKKRYGSLDALAKTATEDPFAFGADVLSLVGGGASIVGKSGQLSNAISKVSKIATSPVTKTAEFVSPLVKQGSKYITSQFTGLNPETITELIKNPSAFKDVSPTARIETATAVKDALDSRLSDLSGLGKEYQVLRDSGQIVTIPEGTIKTVLNKYGLKLDDNNQILTTPESRPISAGDRIAIQDFINNYGNERVLSSNAFLNTREALSNLAKYDQAKTSVSTAISRDLRSVYDDLGKKQIKGLNELDTQYAPERQLLGQLKKDIFDAKGELKDGAISKIANITGKGKEQFLGRVKEIIPDIEQRVNLLKATEDIERASGIKVGTYTRSALGAGGAIFGASTGNIPVLIGAILTQPSIAVPLLKGAGYVGQKAAPIVNALKSIANDVNNFRLPAQFIDQDTGQLKAGLSIKDIAKNISLSEKGTLRDFTDYVNGSYKPDSLTLKNLKRDTQEIVNKYGFSSATKGDKALSRQIGEYLDSVGYDRKLTKGK